MSASCEAHLCLFDGDVRSEVLFELGSESLDRQVAAVEFHQGAECRCFCLPVFGLLGVAVRHHRRPIEAGEYKRRSASSAPCYADDAEQHVQFDRAHFTSEELGDLVPADVAMKARHEERTLDLLQVPRQHVV